MSFPLFDLPPELVIRMIEIMYDDDRCSRSLEEDPFAVEDPNDNINPYINSVGALRLTCRLLANLAEPISFRFLNTTKLNSQDTNTTVDHLSRNGHWVTEVVISFARVHPTTLRSVIDRNTQIMEYCPNVRHLTVHHSRSDAFHDKTFFRQVRALRALDEVRIADVRPRGVCAGIQYNHATNYFAHRLLDVVLDAHAPRLRTLVVSGDTPLAVETFEKIERNAANLTHFRIVCGLCVELRDALHRSSGFAWASRLQHIQLIRCQGVHAAIFTRQLAAGVFGHPRSVVLSMCGDWSDEEAAPQPYQWNIPPIEQLGLDHCAVWEMWHLSQIHAKKVYLSRACHFGSVWGEEEAVIQAIGAENAFPEARELHVTPEWQDLDFAKLQNLCFGKGYHTVERDWRFEDAGYC